MLMKIWTGTLLFLLFASFVALMVAVAHEKDIHPFRDVVRLFKGQSWVGRILLGVFAFGMWVYASVKPSDGGGSGGGGGDGGTNNVPQMAPGPGVGNLQPMNLPGGEIHGVQGQAQFNPDLHPVNQPLGGGVTLNLSGFEPITSTNTAHTIEATDFERGFVMTRIGTDEEFDFTPPSNATTVNDWRAFGAANDWIYAAFTNWTFKVATNDVSRLRIYSFGKVDPLIREVNGAIATNNWFAPFVASLGIVPQANWSLLNESDRPSQVWYAITPEGSLVITWQNALLDRDTDKPISFQIEFKTDGQFIYRYDLSRLDVDSVTNILAGASFAGNTWATNSMPTNVTSMAFYPLSASDAYDQDPDNDGLLTIDELFFYHTNPHNADTDYDGLNDGEELLVYSSDPLDPYSIGSDYSDGFAIKIGDLNPFSFPEGSTNTVLEHIFYTGTTNGVFTYPQSSESMAVLQVSVSGSGTGDLIVGNQVVPLVAPPQLRSAPPNPMPPLLVQLVRGETYPIYFRGDELLEVSLYSADFAFGVLPTHNTFGHINFPNTVATTPCIHDFNARRKGVYLPMSRDANLLTCTWQGNSNVQVENNPPRAAMITGNFSARGTSGITYSLSHPQYLFGQTSYDQTVRFCPQPPEPDPEDPDPPWYSNGDGDDSDDNDDDHDEHWCCYWGVCDGWCGCGCDCGNNTGEPLPGEEDLDDECPTHSMPYEDCAYLHDDDYTNAVQNVQHLGGVLYIREPPFYEQIHLDVPTEHRNCCPCPDHWTNYVGVAYKSYRLRLIDSNGMNFSKTETSCDVNLAGVYPSSAVGDATLAFSRNGEIYQQHNKTVLGVAIKGDYGVDLAAYNALNSTFGYPMTVCTNLWDAPLMRLVTNVKLPDGKVHLELANATGQFTFWYYDNTTWEYRKLLDTDTATVKDISMTYWKALMRRATYGDSSELPLLVTSSTPGHVSLIFRYWNVIDGKFVQDQTVQRITSLRPPMRLDISRDGAIDDGDSAAWFDNQEFYYWINQDTIRGDRIGQINNSVANSGDLLVNGTFDLVNFFPVALDLSKFTDAWQNRVTYTLYPEWGNTNSFNFCFADVPWNRAGSIQTTNVTTLAGQPLSSASLTSLPKTGYQLHYYDTLTQFSENSGLLICEAKSRYAALRIDIKVGDTLLYSYSVPMTILPVKEMYSWYNFRSLSGDTTGRETTLRSHPEAYTKSLIFLHGANVSSGAAEEWGDILFKRLWISGSRARFYNVDWRSDIDSDANYHQNASNAFVVASQIVSTITNSIPGEKVVMAHSLGNMVVSSMIHDYGLQVSKYLMCNSAVPAEAYDRSMSLRTSKLVHPDWEEYPTNSWTASWHTLFKDDLNDDRKYLGWPGRFTNVLNKAVNFYSTSDQGGDEVLELAIDNDVGILTGVMSSLAHHSWHKQELFKGRGLGVGAGATDWSGWNIEENWLGVNKISVSEAQQMQPEDFKTNTVFYCYPSSMNSTNITLLVRGAHLALGIPALVAATGVTDLSDILDQENSFNLDLTNPGIEHPNGWPSKSSYPNRWLHSDIKDVSYFFNFKFYEKVIEKGGLR